ncbi:MAG: hypothetical protein Q8O88_00835 [bacterium]|nr:hypothetical protein [bacterium]
MKQIELVLKPRYVVEIQETDKDSIYYCEWFRANVCMCNTERHCGCADKEAGLENCDHFFDDTDDYEVAKLAKESYETRGDKVRIKKVN